MTDSITLPTGLEWAKEHGERFRFHVVLDNYEQHRDFAYGDIYRYDRNGGDHWLIDNTDVTRLIFKDYAKGIVLLIDDGRTVRPMYLTGWNHGGAYFMVQPMPTNFDANGEPIMRGDRQVNYSSWMLGPRRCYHLKIINEKGAPS